MLHLHLTHLQPQTVISPVSLLNGSNCSCEHRAVTQKNVSFSSVWAEDTASFHVQIKLSLITEPSMRFRAEKKKKKKNKKKPEWDPAGVFHPLSVLFSRQKYAASWEQMNRRWVSLQHTCNMYTFVSLFVLYVFILAFFSCACMHFWSV